MSSESDLRERFCVIGTCSLVPYYRPADKVIGDAVRGLAGRRAAVLLADHGPVVAGKTLDAALAAVGQLEEINKRHLLPSGRNPRLLTPEQVTDPHAHLPN